MIEYKFGKSIVVQVTWKEYLNKKLFNSFLTVALSNKPKNHKDDIERFLKGIHVEIFGDDFMKKQQFLSMAYVQKNISSREVQYHFIIENDERFTVDRLKDAITEYVIKSKGNSEICKNDKNGLTINTCLTGKMSSNVHMNLVEIKTKEDQQRIIKFLLKDVDNGIGKLWFMDEMHNFPIMVVH